MAVQLPVYNLFKIFEQKIKYFKNFFFIIMKKQEVGDKECTECYVEIKADHKITCLYMQKKHSMYANYLYNVVYRSINKVKNM